MRHLYILMTFFSYSFLCLSAQAQLTSKEILELKENPRTTNLIIFNDVYENSIKKLLTPSTLKKDGLGVVTEELAEALSGLAQSLATNQLVLCTKSLWINLQNIVEIWLNYAQTNETKLISDHEAKINSQSYQNLLNELEEYEISLKTNQKSIEDIKKSFNRLKNTNKEKDILDISNFSTAIKSLQKKYDQINTSPNDLDKDIDYFNVSNSFMAEFLTIYMSYQIILAHEYTCKQVTPEYLLFLPKDLVRKYSKPAMQNFWVGFDFTDLANYDHTQFLSEKENIKFFKKTLTIAQQNSLGSKLLQALTQLKIHTTNNQTSSIPFFNVFIIGHGELKPHPLVAEISSKLSKANNQTLATSDLLKILRLFNHAYRKNH